MASRSVRATAVVVFVVFCGTTDGALAQSEHSCNELDVRRCLVHNADGGKGHDILAAIQKVCSGKVKTCTEIKPLDKCPKEYRTRILAMENSLQKAADAVCQKGTFSKDVTLTIICWRLSDLESCVGAIKTATPELDHLKHNWRQQDWDHFNTELSKCIEGLRDASEECQAADFGPVKKIIEILFTPSPPPNNGSGLTSAAFILTAFVSLLVSLAF
ncbi:uncharacterized protein LOC144167197 [Haemaphysalis longicornis]